MAAPQAFTIDQGWGTYLLSQAALIVDDCWRAAKTINLIQRFNLYLTMRDKGSLDILFKYLLVM